jgi:hypothetical protein
VDRVRQHVLARAALAEQQHRGIGVRHLARGLERALHRGARRFEQRRRLERAAELAIVAAQGRELEGARDEQAHLVEREGLHQVVEGALLHRLDGPGDGGIGGHQDDLRVRPARAQLAQQREAVHAGHAHVGEHELDRLGREHAQRFGRVRRAQHAVAEPAEVGREVVADVLLVVDDEHGRHRRDATSPLRAAARG